MERFTLLACTLIGAAVIGGASAAAQAATPRCPAKSCAVSIAAPGIAGAWNCFRTPSGGSPTNVVYTFVQSGNRFNSSGETSYKVFGRIEGTALNFSEVVGGEELEGYVLYAQGHLIPVNGVANRGIVSVYHTSQGGVGSFNCMKQ